MPCDYALYRLLKLVERFVAENSNFPLILPLLILRKEYCPSSMILVYDLVNVQERKYASIFHSTNVWVVVR